MITSDELEYLVEKAINVFRNPLKRNVNYYEDVYYEDEEYEEDEEYDEDEEYYEDVAWDYARGVLEDTLDKDKKQDLYSKVIKKLNEGYKNKIKFSKTEYKIEFPNNNDTTIDLTNEKKRAILLFLMDYNHTRFIKQLKKTENGVYDYSKLEKYIKGFLDAIDDILSKKESISDNNSAYDNTFKCVKKLIYEKMKQNEYVATAKILMLLNPNKFIAWDNQIAKRFRLSLTSRGYKIFNDLIDEFISKKEKEISNMNSQSYYDYEIKKLLDMIFWIAYNKINISKLNNNTNTSLKSPNFLELESPPKFYCYTERLVHSILQLDCE